MRKSWKYIPVDDIGYINSEEMLLAPNHQIERFIQVFEHNRYSGVRNWRNLWRSTLGLDTTHGKRIHDFGCGFGIEALQFCKSGNEVYVSDIYPSNVQAAERVLRLSGYKPAPDGTFDIFYSNGVLHHSPRIREILQDAVKKLNPGGEIRLLLYSDKAWEVMTGTPLPPISDDVTKHPSYAVYLEKMDPGVGEYADWYNREKLEMRVGDFLRVEKFNYIMPKGIFATMILKPHEHPCHPQIQAHN